MTTLDLISTHVTAMSQKDVATLDALRSDNFELDFVHGDAFENKPMSGQEASRFWEVWFAGFSRFDYEVTRTIAADEVAAVEWIFTGKHDQPLGEPVFAPPIAAKQRIIRIRGMSVFDITGGQISRETIYIDLATLVVELGAELR